MFRLASGIAGGLVLASFAACAPDTGRTPTFMGGAPVAADPGAPGQLGVLGPAGAAPTTETYPLPPAAMPTPDEPALPVMPPMAARPVSGGTLLVLAKGPRAVASDADRDQIYIVDLATTRLAGAVTLNVGDEPGRLVEDAAGRVHVALRGGGAIVTIDPARGTILSRRALCAAPRGLAVDKVKDELHVACASGELVSIATEPTTTTPRRTLKLERDLRDVLVTGNRLVVSTFRSADVLVVGEDGSVSTRLDPGADPTARTSTAVAWRMIEGPDGSPVVLHQRGVSNSVSTQPGGYGRGSTCGSIVTSAISTVNLNGQGSSGAPLTSALVAADIALSPDGKEYAVVSIGGGDQSHQMDFVPVEAGSTNSFGCTASTNAPQKPSSEMDGGSGEGLPSPAVYLPPNGEVVAVAYDRRGNVLVQSREPATLQILTQRVDPITLSNDSRFDAGHQLFHTATSNRIACVSCHPEGGEDGRVWTFQTFGARRTQSLRGGIINTAPFHWSGDEASFGALMTDVFQSRMGGAPATPARVADLAAWLNQIPHIASAPSAEAQAISRGKGLFASAGCAACHSGRDFTNGLTVDVGTGGMFQVPQLHDLASRAPYMHNGCAPTLRDRLRVGPCGGDERHGAVGGLSSTQVDDLIAYLETL